MRSQPAVAAAPAAFLPATRPVRTHPVATPVLFAALLGDAVVTVLALAFSVTYWDQQGWKDTFGKAA